ncbi:glutamate receptor 2-like [Octopus vulgaris]|uniref:Glutamate receptor 2-like n=1 Tax=Octopus vulgaris TaxID=6645 RepID=A0AA36BV78_OCTVU|nr:glutamate receptor 2-like [Octopus vulgaris]
MLFHLSGDKQPAMYLLLLVLALGKQIVGHTNLDHLKIAAVIEHSKYHDGLIDLKEYICHRINMRVTFEMYNVSSMNPVFLDGLVHDVVSEDIDLIIWLVSCDMLDFLPNKVSSEAVMLFLTEEKCSVKDPVDRKGSSQKFKGLADAMHYLKWPDVKIFYDESINGTEILMLTNELSSRYVKSALFRINSSSSFTEKIRRTFISINQKAFSENRYLMILKKQTLEVVIKEAASLWMLVSRNYWILISDDMDVESLVQYGLNPRNANLVIFKDACDICREDLKPIEEATNEIQLTANITGFAVPKNYSTLNHSCYTAYEMKSVTEGPLLTSTVARWRPDSKLFVMREFYPNAKYRLGNITLNVSTLTLLPYAVKKESHGKIYFEGFCVKILKELSQQMNFSYNWVVPEDREFGMMVNGSFTGLVGLLERRISSIDNLKDLADDKDILPFTLAGSAIYTEFKNRTDAVGREIFRQMQRAPVIKNAAHSLDYVRTGKYVLISLWSEVKLYAARYCHEFIVPGHPFTLKTIGFGLQKGSALTAEVSHLCH